MEPLRHARGSYPVKLLVLVAVVVVLVAGAAGVVSLHAGQAVAADAEQSVADATTQQATSLEQWTGDLAERTETIAATVGEGDADAPASDDAATADADDSTLASEAERLPRGAEAVHVLDGADGTVLSSSEADAEGAQYGALAGFEPDATSAAFTDALPDPVTGEPTVLAVAAVDGADDRLVAVPVDLEARSAALARPAAGDGASAQVVDAEGTVLFGHDAAAIGTTAAGVDDALAAAAAGEAGTEETDAGEGSEVVGYAPVDGTDWTVTTRVPAENAHALGDEVTQALLALLGVALLGIVTIGVVIGHNSARDLRDLAAATRRVEEGALDAPIETNRDDELGQLAESVDGLRASLASAREEAAEERSRADAREADLDALAGELEESVEAFEAAIDRARTGDFTARVDADEDEELADLAEAFDGMLAAMEDTTDRLKRFAGDVATRSEEVTASAEEVQRAGEQVSISIQEISETTETQARTFDRVADRVEDVSDTTESIAERAASVSEVAERTAETGSRGREAARDAVMAMESIDASSEGAAEEMRELERLVDEIDEVAEFISEISEEVNVLALNANIEAARSGGDGDEGFEVVAKEVKDLAAETKFSAQRIENLVGEVKVQTELSVSEVDSTREAVTDGRETVAEAIESLDRIAAYAETTHEGVREISEATETQADTTADVVSMVDHAANLSREVDREAETVAAAAEQQTSALTEVTGGVDRLSREARTLRDAMERFDTDVEPEDDPGWLPEGVASGTGADEDTDGDRSTAESDGSTADGDHPRSAADGGTRTVLGGDGATR